MHSAITRLAVASSVALVLSQPVGAAGLLPTGTFDGQQQQARRSKAAEAVQQRPETSKTPPPGEGRKDTVLMCVVPDLRGGTQERAQGALASANLRIGNVQTRKASQRPGTVVVQRPEPKTQIRCGLPVDIWLADGSKSSSPETSEVPPDRTGCVVPDVTGHLVRESKEALARHQFYIGQITTRESDRPSGTVLEQSPASGTQQKCRSQIALVVAANRPDPPTCVVPNLAGSEIGDVRKPLGRADLVLGSVRERTVDGRAGTVLDQRPRGGTHVACRSQVDVLIAAPTVMTCAVPTLIGRDTKTAAILLEKGRLRLGTVDRRESDEAPGIVLEQSPLAGLAIRCDTEVRVWVAAEPIGIRVPMLLEHDEMSARNMLASVGLVLGEVGQRESDQPSGTVVAQSPVAGTLVKRRSPVQIQLAIPQPIKVPDLRGMDRAMADDTLSSKRLRLGAVADRPSDRKEGTIIEQAPAPGTPVGVGTAVQVWLAVATLPLVPDVRGMNRAAAAQALTATQLRLRDAGERESDRAEGTVVEQTPAPGASVRQGTPVEVWLAIPPRATVPDLRGQDRASAADALAKARLRLGGVGDREADRAEGSVVEQTPAPGTSVRQGTPVQVWLAVPLPATVPELHGQDRTAAADALTKARLRLGDVGERQSDLATGTVVEQSPSPGTIARVGTDVQVWLAVPPVPAIEMPDLAGRPRAEAERMISERGLVLRVTTSEPSPNTADTVIRQTPGAGARVNPGTGVALVLATAIVIPVPDLVGRTGVDASAILQAAGLQMGTVTPIRAIAAKGTVIGQFPRAGTNALPGATIDVEVASFDLALLWILAAGLGVGGAAAVAASRVYQRRRDRTRRSISLAPHGDRGVQTTFPDGRGLASSELTLESFTDEGIQTLQAR